MLKYVEFIQNIVYAPGSVKVVFKGSEKTTIVGKLPYPFATFILGATNLTQHCLTKKFTGQNFDVALAILKISGVFHLYRRLYY